MKFRDITFAEGDYYNRQHFHDNKFLSKSSAMEERKLCNFSTCNFLWREKGSHTNPNHGREKSDPHRSSELSEFIIW